MKGRRSDRAARPGPAAGAFCALIILALVILALSAGSGLAGEIVGRPQVIDGNRLDFSGLVVRLHGIDAPDREQTCRAAGRTWPCGNEARWAAINRIHPHWVTCVETGTAPGGEVRAVCYLAGIGEHDLNAWMVAQGWALAERRVSQDYVDEEAAARAAGRGLWRGEFVPPGQWRRGKRLSP